MKQFAHNRYLPRCQGMETCSFVSFIQHNIYTPVPGASRRVENRSCPESTRCFSQCVIPLSWCQSRWVMAEWLRRWLDQPGAHLGRTGPRRARCWVARGVSKILVSRFNTGIRLVRQFAHNWYLPCCQYMETCSHVSFIQNNIDTNILIKNKWTNGNQYKPSWKSAEIHIHYHSMVWWIDQTSKNINGVNTSSTRCIDRMSQWRIGDIIDFMFNPNQEEVMHF